MYSRFGYNRKEDGTMSAILNSGFWLAVAGLMLLAGVVFRLNSLLPKLRGVRPENPLATNRYLIRRAQNSTPMPKQVDLLALPCAVSLAVGVILYLCGF